MIRFVLVFATLLSLLTVTDARAEKIKVACVGNSITYGAGIVNREKNSYPAQLQAFLGEEYEVRNFGISARTLMNSSDLPYIREAEYQASKDFNPDIVLIKLGTNDLKPRNNGGLSKFYKSDYSALIDSYKTLPSHPRVVLLTPTRFWVFEEFSAEALIKYVIPALEELALEKGTELINLYSLFSDTHEPYLMPDKLHPSSIGAGMIAQKIGTYLTQPREQVANLALPYPYAESTTFNFHGYPGHDFKLADGTPCKIVQPKQAAEGKPWIWRARFWGHEPQTDVALLELGFHVVYCDVADLYGSPEAVKRWDNFYKNVAMPLGFAKKVALEGMSRGGLIIYNWAVANPEKVACIYADAPVLDFKSWPMGLQASDGSKSDTENLMKVYGFKNAEAAEKYRHNPVDNVKKLAKSGIPMLHVVGDADDVVPVSENTAIFEAAVKAAGGDIHVIHKPSIGHHPHSLANPQPIVEFILQHTGQLQNICVHPIPGNEYRAGAGWSGDADWHAVSEEITAMLSERKNLDVLLIGNSITQGFGGERKLVSYKPGKQFADSVWGNSWFSAGISGDRTQHILWRIQKGNYEACSPKNVVITIGINNLYETDTPEMVAEGVRAVAAEAAKHFRGSNIFILGPLPAGNTKESALRVKCDATHALLSRVKWSEFGENLHYVNPTAWFVDGNGDLKTGAYTGDYVHLIDGGYALWCSKIAEMIK